jgi:hypothetical protein
VAGNPANGPGTPRNGGADRTGRIALQAAHQLVLFSFVFSVFRDDLGYGGSDLAQ